MANHSQIVPSKNALRALRKLALGGSTVVGAVGSVSGLACVSYDIRQRIHLAESIVETKRILHSQSVSNPNRKAHMAAICDMYEQGQVKEANESWQDFRRRARRKPAETSCHESRGDSDTTTQEDAVYHVEAVHKPVSLESSSRTLALRGSTVPPLPPKVTWQGKPRRLEELTLPRSTHNSSIAQRIIEATQNPHKVNSHAAYGRPQESHDTSPVQRIITATQKQHKLSSHVVFGRPKQTKEEVEPQFARCVQQWLAPGCENQQLATNVAVFRKTKALHIQGQSHPLVRQYSALAAKAQNRAGYPEMWTANVESGYNNPFFSPANMKATTDDHDREVSLIALRSAQSTVIGAVSEEDKAQEIHRTRPEEIHQNAQVPTQDVQSSLMVLMEKFMWKPRIGMKDVHDISAFSETSADVVASPTDPSMSSWTESTKSNFTYLTKTTANAIPEPSAVLERLFTTITEIRRIKGVNAARALAQHALNMYAQGGRPEDFRAMDQLHLEFAPMLQLPNCLRPIRQLIHYFLNTGFDEDRRRAGRLLFHHDINNVPTNDSASSVLTYRYGRNAMAYIDWICSSFLSNYSVVHEFRKVLQAGYQRGASPSEALFLPVLQRFLEQGDLKYLRNMFNEMKAAHGIEPSALTRTVLLFGHAKAKDWGYISIQFEQMHKTGLSRKEPVSFAVMFDEILREHANSEPVEQTHDFLVNAICYWGLMPITRVSTTAVQTYIRQRRYDLVKEWIEAIRHMFPQVDNTSHAFALSLAKTWSEIGASCEEIEDACVAIFRGRDNVVPGHFRAIVQEALAGHLAQKLHAVGASGSALRAYSKDAETTDDLSGQLKSAFAVISEHAGESGVIRHSSVADLLAQSNAALRLRDLFGAKIRIRAPQVRLAPRLERVSGQQTIQHRDHTTDLTTPIPSALCQEHLPDRESVISLVSGYYSQRLKLGESTNHDILKTTCRQLSLTRRRFDILTLISHVYKSPAVQGSKGIMFDLDIVQYWMEAAYHLKSAAACRDIFIAMLEKGTAIQLTQQFMLLVKMASDKAFGTRFSGATREVAGMAAELRHLHDRLRDRFYAQQRDPDRKRGRKFDGLLRVSASRESKEKNPGGLRGLSARPSYRLVS